jgi:hypothetical protein
VRLIWLGLIIAGTLALAAASGAGSPAKIKIPPAKPPSPSTWPAYPSFSARSCWTTPLGEGFTIRRYAPSTKPRPGVRPVVPEAIVRRALARLGDRRFVRRIELGPPPPVTLRHVRGYYRGVRPPKDALWAYISAPAARLPISDPTPERMGEFMVAQWEASLVAGALRDDFCAAGGRSLVGWTLIRGAAMAISDRADAFTQRFPNPSPQAFRRRVELIGRRYGFSIVSLLLLHPRQLAPLLVVQTSRNRTAFVRDVPQIMTLLNPSSSVGRQTAVTFEGFLLEARDANGPFVRVGNGYRGEVRGGGQWSWNRCVYPYAVRGSQCRR